ncbi:putative inorganic phosphate cotransporter isoform X2 [Eupeodes corollae]|uniref:putative inorganic phosphate cotransporter isoform X2 n=1 Tax=Eupeodes corollae TaxID=290404 RepID=UPI0024918658|nr:putative inorganic phosphate cotransporter isoform X2 [Eupeodes corollae]
MNLFSIRYLLLINTFADLMNYLGPVLGVRHVQVLLLFLCIVVNYMGRLNVSVAVVAMTNAKTTNPNYDEYSWNEKQKSYILSSFYWGYILTQFPGSYMCRKCGAKFTMFISTLGSAFLSFITPICMPLGDGEGWQVYCGIRVVQGLFQGLFYSCIHEHLAKWSPVEERTRLGALCHTGMEIGTILAMGVTGLIAQSSLGWPGISYISGGLGLVWCAVWLLFADNTPTTSKFISSEELRYILDSQLRDDSVHKKITIPWKAIFTSVPFFSLMVVRSAEAWGYSTIQAEIPSYLRGVLDMDIKINAFFSALPFLAMFIISYIYLIATDILLKKDIFTLATLRKTINSIAMWIPSATLVAVGFLDETQKILAIVLMTLTVGFNGGVTIGSGLNTIDLSSNHAVILIGIINTVVSCVSLVTPLSVGIIVTDATDRSQWQIIFIISAVMFFLGNLQFIFLGTTETQVWNHENFLAGGTPNIEQADGISVPKCLKPDPLNPMDSYIWRIE